MSTIETIEDVVLEHVEISKRRGAGTSEGLEFLELKDIPANISAANIYTAALRIIAELQKCIRELEGE